MRIGLDLDNTIVSYDKSIAQLAVELFKLSEDVCLTKLGIRDYMRAEGRESEWTILQGELYGPGMRYAEPYEGAVETMEKLIAAGHELIIISHRTRRPYAGQAHDLHAAARGWVASRLQVSGILGTVGDNSYVHLLETREEKLKMIGHMGCEAFLDDLPEILCSSIFPPATKGILFDPTGLSGVNELNAAIRITNWVELPDILF